MVTQEIEAALDAADERLVGVLDEPQFVESLVHDLHRTAQLVARRGQHNHIIHIAHAEEPGGFEARVQLPEEERTE